MAKFIKLHVKGGEDPLLINIDYVAQVECTHYFSKGNASNAFVTMADGNGDFTTEESFSEVQDIIARATGIISSANKSRTSGVE